MIRSLEQVRNHPLEELTASVGHLTETDNELKAVVERLVNAVPRASRTYLITWPARSDRMAELMKQLANPDTASGTRLVGQYKWLTHDRTPYARIGRLPTGMSFDGFCDRLQHDLAVVHEVQKASHPTIWSGKHPHVYVQQIGDRVDVP